MKKCEHTHNEESRYEIIVNLDTKTKKVYEKYFETEGYQFLANKDTLLFVKKEGKKANIEHEDEIVQLILNMIKKYFYVGILYINLTDEINEILQKAEKMEKLNLTDNYITLPIKRAFEKAILDKNVSITSKLSEEKE